MILIRTSIWLIADVVVGKLFNTLVKLIWSNKVDQIWKTSAIIRNPVSIMSKGQFATIFNVLCDAWRQKVVIPSLFHSRLSISSTPDIWDLVIFKLFLHLKIVLEKTN